MKNNEIYIILRDNSFICRTPENNKSFICEFDIDNIPNVPFYHHLWSDPAKNRSIFTNFVNKQIHNGNILKKVLLPALYIAKPSDSVNVDERILFEFFQVCGAKKINMVNECFLLTRSTNSYVSVIQTCRMIVVCYVKNEVIKNTLYIENKENIDMLSIIKSLHTDCHNDNIPVFLHGTNLDKYSDIGTFVSLTEMHDNFIIKYDNSKKHP